MRPLSCHRDHLAWQQRVSKERIVVTDFVRTFGSTRLPPSHLLDFKDFFPLRRPASLTSVPSNWTVKQPVQSFGGTILGKRLREVRGKYSRPAEEVNGLLRLRTGADETRSKTVLRRPLTGSTAKKPTLSADTSPRRQPSKAYIQLLRAQLQAEREKRAAVESHLAAIL